MKTLQKVNRWIVMTILFFLVSAQPFMASAFVEPIASPLEPDTKAPEFTTLIDERIGTPFLVTPREGKTYIPLKTERDATLEEKVWAFLEENKSLYGIVNPREEFIISKIFQSKDETHMHHIRMKQQKNGINVFGAELIIHFDEDKNIRSATSSIVPYIHASSLPTLTKKEAETLLQAGEGESTLQSTDPISSELVYYNPAFLSDVPVQTLLAWKVENVSSTSLLDATTGDILLSYSNIHESLNRNVFSSGGTPFLPGLQIMNESGFLYDPLLIPDWIESDAQFAYTFSAETYNYFLSIFGRDSYDDNGASIQSNVNYFQIGKCPNAAWVSTLSLFIYCNQLPSADDVVAHEFTHAVTDTTSDLLYLGQPGALNESYSDVFGAMVDREDWLIGEDLSRPIRSMQDPTLFNQPDHVMNPLFKKIETPCDERNDYCGVHRNSGVPNKAAYLLAEPGVHQHYGISVEGIGREKTEQIYYKTLTEMLTPVTSFGSAYLWTAESCRSLIGYYGITSSDCAQVDNAFKAVGINTLQYTLRSGRIDDCFGKSVSSAGDVNRDGFEDLIVGTCGAYAQLFYGGSPANTVPDLTFSSVDEGIGEFVSGIGDLNNDGFDDIIIGSRSLGGRGEIFLGGSPMDSEVDYVLVGGYPMSGAGDVNGDSYDDVILGPNIFYGSQNMNADVDVRLFPLSPTETKFGSSVSTGGDVNNDRYDDVIIGSPYDTNQGSESYGRSYIYYGSSTMNNIVDVILNGEQESDHFGFSVSNAGDVNGDQFDDVIVGTDSSYDNRGFVYYGGSSMNSNPDVRIDVVEDLYFDHGGLHVSNARDINNDSFSDVIVGNPNAYYFGGNVTVYFGGRHMDAMPDAEKIGKPFEQSYGNSISDIGDYNRDNFNEIAIGSNEGPNSGSVYIHYGY